MWPNPQGTSDLVTFTEEILNDKLHILCSVTVFYAVKFPDSPSRAFKVRTLRSLFLARKYTFKDQQVAFFKNASRSKPKFLPFIKMYAIIAFPMNGYWLKKYTESVLNVFYSLRGKFPYWELFWYKLSLRIQSESGKCGPE